MKNREDSRKCRTRIFNYKLCKLSLYEKRKEMEKSFVPFCFEENGNESYDDDDFFYCFSPIPLPPPLYLFVCLFDFCS